MIQERRTAFQTQTLTFLWLLGAIFALIVTFAYLQQPYGGSVSSLLSGKELPAGNDSSLSFDASSSKPNTYGYISHSNNTYSTDRDPVPTSNDISQRSFDFESVNSKIDDPENHQGDGSGSVTEGGETNEGSFPSTTENLGSSVKDELHRENITLVSENMGSSSSGFVSPIPAVSPTVEDVNVGVPEAALSPKSEDVNISAPEVEDPLPELGKEEELEPLRTNITILKGDSPVSGAIEKKKFVTQERDSGVVSISEMKYLLRQSRASYHSAKPKWSSPADQELSYARTQMEKAPHVEDDSELYSPLYNNFSRFKRSYDLMEKMLKVYVYKEGARPIFHRPVVKGIYASEGWFMKQLESSKTFLTRNPSKAHLFYLPFSTRMLEETLYVPDSHSNANLVQYLKSYLDLITARYSFWNRTDGADHFLVACHDWAPSETREWMANCIRSLCNSDVKEGFVFGKDASLPETYIPTPKKPLGGLGGKPPSKRPILAFFAGRMHGYVRPSLLQHWGGNREPDMRFFGVMPHSKRKNSYVEHMKSSKYCICAKGYEVNSPRVVEAIFYECVPVIISDNFVPPFFEVLNWESFSVFVLEKDIPNLKNILLSIPGQRYREMQKRVKKVQQHFLWHPKPVRYDVFHMILHSVWYNRVFRA